jgi:hypothetical protein
VARIGDELPIENVSRSAALPQSNAPLAATEQVLSLPIISINTSSFPGGNDVADSVAAQGAVSSVSHGRLSASFNRSDTPVDTASVTASPPPQLYEAQTAPMFDITRRSDIAAFETLLTAVVEAAKDSPIKFSLTLAFGEAFSSHAVSVSLPLWRTPLLRVCSEQGLDALDALLVRNSTAKPHLAEDMCGALKLLTAFTEAHASNYGAASASGAALISLVLAIRMTDYWSALQELHVSSQQQENWRERAREGIFVLLATVSRGLKRICFSASDELPLPVVQSNLISGPALLAVAAADTGGPGAYLVSQLQSWVGHRLGKHRSTSFFWRNPSAIVNRDTASIVLHATLLLAVVPARGSFLLPSSDSPLSAAPPAVETAIAQFIASYIALTPTNTSEGAPPLTPGSIARSITGFFTALRWTLSQASIDGCFSLCRVYAQLAAASFVATVPGIAPEATRALKQGALPSGGSTKLSPGNAIVSPDAQGRSVACREATAVAVALAGAIVREDASTTAARRCVAVAEAASTLVASFVTDDASAAAAGLCINTLLLSVDGGDPYGMAQAFAAALVRTLSARARPIGRVDASVTAASALARICEVSVSLAPAALPGFEELTVDSNASLSAVFDHRLLLRTAMAPSLARRLALRYLQQYQEEAASPAVAALTGRSMFLPPLAAELLSFRFSPAALSAEGVLTMDAYVSPLIVLFDKVTVAAARAAYSTRSGERGAVIAALLSVLTLPLDPAAADYSTALGPGLGSQLTPLLRSTSTGNHEAPLPWWDGAVALTLLRPACDRLCAALQVRRPGMASQLIAELSDVLAAKEEAVVTAATALTTTSSPRVVASKTSLSNSPTSSNSSPPSASSVKSRGSRVGSWLMAVLKPPVSFQPGSIPIDIAVPASVLEENWIDAASAPLLSRNSMASSASSSLSIGAVDLASAVPAGSESNEAYEPPSVVRSRIGDVADNLLSSAESSPRPLPQIYDAVMSAFCASLLSAAIISSADSGSTDSDLQTAAAALLPELSIFLPLSVFPAPQSNFGFIVRSRQTSGAGSALLEASVNAQPRLCYLALCYAAGIAEAAFFVLDARAAAWTALSAASVIAPEATAAAASMVTLPLGFDCLAALRRAYNSSFQGGLKDQWQLTKLGSLYVPSSAFERLDRAISAVEAHIRDIATQTYGMGRMTPLTVLLSRQTSDDARGLSSALAAWGFQLPIAHCVSTASIGGM